MLSGLSFAATIAAAPAHAQLAASIGVESDYRFRGISLTDRRPAATVQIAYDDPSGIYANVSGIGALGRDGPRFVGVLGNVGYARRIGPKLYVDGGIVRSEYEAPYRRRRSRHYTEAYVGLGYDRFIARLSYSPDYFHPDAETLYGEVEAAIQPAPEWRLNAHVGTLVYLRSPYYLRHTTYYDWRVGASRQLGNVEVHAALSGGGPGKDYYGGYPRSRTALTAGASWSF